jgi:PAS domain S-box-containing protein
MPFPLSARQQESAHFEALFRYATMGILITDNSGIITAVNPFALNEFGYTENELLGKRIELLIPHRFREQHIQYHDAYFKNPQTRKMGRGVELIGLKKNNAEFPVEISLSSYVQDDAAFVITFVNDISERKNAEQAIKKLNADLESTVELRTADLKKTQDELKKSLAKERELSELKTRFITTASHEFRTPLSTVLSSAYLVGKYTTTAEQAKREKHLQHITSSVEMLTSILNDFLSVGKIEEGRITVRPVLFDLPAFITAATEELKSILKDEQKIIYRHKGEQDVIMDPLLLKHIIINLVSNASKFSPENSCIQITTITGNDQTILTVKDDGTGIAAEDQQHLTERFFRGANASGIQGTGLGLHIVARYAALLNGQLHWKSEPGKGTQFTITFTAKTGDYEKDIID